MIIRILSEGQFEVPDDHAEELNRLDSALVDAVASGSDSDFTTALQALLAGVRTVGKPLPDDFLGPSDLVLPGPEATIDEVRELLGEEGLIPG
jgi:hypothetical protein